MPPELPRYRCHKIVRAAVIGSIFPGTHGDENTTLILWLKPGRDARVEVTQEWYLKHKPHAGGYYVVYDDGYASYSPADAFIGGYTPILQETRAEDVPADWINQKLDGSPRHPSTSGILKFFRFEHLPPRLQTFSKPLAVLARQMADELPEGPELTAGLRKLLEAKDCFVRSAV